MSLTIAPGSVFLNELFLSNAIDSSVAFNWSTISEMRAAAAAAGSRGVPPFAQVPFVQDVCGGGLPSGNWSMTSTDVVEEHTLYVRLRFVLDVYVVLVLCLIGFVGNALAIAVLRRDQVKSVGIVDIGHLFHLHATRASLRLNLANLALFKFSNIFSRKKQ